MSNQQVTIGLIERSWSQHRVAAMLAVEWSELMELCSSPASKVSIKPGEAQMAVWSTLYLALEESLVSRFGRLGFFHDYLRQAVEREYHNDLFTHQSGFSGLILSICDLPKISHFAQFDEMGTDSGRRISRDIVHPDSRGLGRRPNILMGGGRRQGSTGTCEYQASEWQMPTGILKITSFHDRVSCCP